MSVPTLRTADEEDGLNRQLSSGNKAAFLGIALLFLWLVAWSVQAAGALSGDTTTASASSPGTSLEAPSALRCQFLSRLHARLLWTASPTSGVEGYRIYHRGPLEQAFSPLDYMAGASTTYDNLRPSFLLHRYHVTAFLGVLESAPSSTIQVHCQPRVSFPSAGSPTLQAENHHGPRTVVLTWDPVWGAHAYVVLRATQSGGPYDILAITTRTEEPTSTDTSTPNEALTPTSPPEPITMGGSKTVAASLNSYRIFLPLMTAVKITYTDMSVSDGIVYYYVVVAVDATGNESDPSEEVTVPDTVPIPTPTATPTAEATETVEPTPDPTDTVEPTPTEKPSATTTPTATPTETPTATPTETPMLTLTPTSTPTSAPTPSDTPTPTETPTPTSTPEPTASPGNTHDFVGDFETGDLTGFYWHQNNPEVVHKDDGHPVRAGDYSMRSYLHRYESQYSYRTEVIMSPTDDTPEGTHGAIMLNNYGGPESEYWIGFSVYLPSDFVYDVERMTDIILQVHGKPDKDAAGNYIEPYRNPILAMAIDHDQWRIWNRWDDVAISGPENSHDNVYYLDLAGSIGAWTDWVINVRWDYHQDGDGFLKIWRNGTIVVDQDGPNCFNDQRGPHIAMGLYKWCWKEKYTYVSPTNERIFYHDELRIAGADASYEDVAP